jgi:hypothetical protein
MTTNFTTFMYRLSWNLGASTSWNPVGLYRPVMKLLCLLPSILTSIKFWTVLPLQPQISKGNHPLKFNGEAFLTCNSFAPLYSVCNVFNSVSNWSCDNVNYPKLQNSTKKTQRTHTCTPCLSVTNRHLLHIDSKQHTVRWWANGKIWKFPFVTLLTYLQINYNLNVHAMNFTLSWKLSSNKKQYTARQNVYSERSKLQYWLLRNCHLAYVYDTLSVPCYNRDRI